MDERILKHIAARLNDKVKNDTDLKGSMVGYITLEPDILEVQDKDRDFHLVWLYLNEILLPEIWNINQEFHYYKKGSDKDKPIPIEKVIDEVTMYLQHEKTTDYGFSPYDELELREVKVFQHSESLIKEVIHENLALRNLYIFTCAVDTNGKVEQHGYLVSVQDALSEWLAKDDFNVHYIT